MPGAAVAVTHQPPSVPNGSLLNANQSAFAGELVKQTGLDPGVVAAWLLAEEPAAATSAPNGANNWLNIGATGSGNFGGSNSAWSNPTTAADLTASWLKGSSIPGFGAASSGIRSILSSAGQSPSAQIHALQTSGWAGSGYTTLPAIYSTVTAHPATLADLGNAVAGAGGAIGGAVGGAASSVAGSVTSTADAIGTIASVFGQVWEAITNPHNWLRALEFLGGAIAVYMALKALAGVETSPADVAGVVAKVAK